jgi:hypothetical protein
MTITKNELRQFECTLSAERLLSFKQSDNDTIEILIERYKNNIRVAQSFYPELLTLEITLRNTIDTMLKTLISETWLEDEIKQQKILLNHEYFKLLEVYNNIKNECLNNNFTTGKIIANLTFGFWTNLCSKKYNATIWTKKGAFKGVFINYPKNLQQQIHTLSLRLRAIRNLRNRIFHYEPVFKNPKNTIKMYNEIIEILSYLPVDNCNILRDTSTFLELYNKIMITNNKKT